MNGRLAALVFLFFSLLAAHYSFAQFSNEWINFTQAYYKIPVAKNGIYRLTLTDLQNAGVPINTIDPRRVNIFHRGTEQAIFIQGQDDARFDTGDFIEFYGKRNDGSLDTDLYKPSTLQPHSYYNLFTDTTAYFLTWNALPIQGKRMANFFETNTSSLTKEPFHTAERLQLYTSDYSGGYTLADVIQNTAFDQGEGWTGPVICNGFSGCTGQQDLVIDNLVQTVPTGGNPQLEIQLVGRGNGTHTVEIYAGANSGLLRLLGTRTFNEYEVLTVNFPLAWSDIGSDGRTTIRARLLNSGSRDQISVSYIKINFAQGFSMTSLLEKIFGLSPNAGNKSYIELPNTPVGARLWDITDTQNVRMIGTTSIPGGLSAIISTTSAGRKIYATGTTLTTSLQKITFRAITPAQSKFIIISHRSLMKPALGYGNAVQAYASYRASAAGGGYDTLTVPIDLLYNQFNYGETSPRAIYQFMKFLTSSGNPSHLFLIGKGLEVSQGFYRKTSFLPTDLRDLVPSAGMPGADMAFTAGLKGTTHEPGVPTGRLTASNPTQVAAYLNKIKETEAMPFNALWRKELLHLSGGINAGEPVVFRQYVDGFKSVAEDVFLGGKVETISKQTLNVELINVKDQVNKGLDLITFFGHSGPGTIDIDIGYVSDPTLGYNNAGKYPGFLINGCNAGRFYDNRVTFGEDWMLTTNKGAKSFIAHSSFGFTTSLKQYSDIFYAVAYGDSSFIGRGIGEIQKEVARRYLAATGANIGTITQAQQMVLLGDPAVPLFGARKPDYEINNGSVSIVSLDGKPVTAQSSSFAVEMNVRNFGRALSTPLKIRLTRRLSDNSIKTYDSTFSAVLYNGTFQFIIKNGRNPNEFGNNSFEVRLDPDQAIGELNEANNIATINFFIPLKGTKNLFPAAYSIVNKTAVDLVFQNTDILAGPRSFLLEMDTASTFDSPYLKRQVLTQKVLATLAVNLLSTDSMVYYWRTKFEKPFAGESNEWATSSFIYIKNGGEGWAQSQFPQLAEATVEGLVKDPQIKRLKFIETLSTVELRTFGSASTTPFTQVSLKINQEEFNVATQNVQCRNNTLNLIAFDKNSTSPYVGVPTSFFDRRSCGRAPKVINSFTTSELETGTGIDLAQYVANIAANDSVVIFSIGDVGYASWSAGVKSLLGQFGVGINQMNGVQPGEPFVIFGKKGASSGSAKIFRPTQTPVNQQEVFVSKTITGRFSDGSVISSIIGPAQQWSQLVTRFTEVTPNDTVSIDITGISLNGSETILKTKLKGDQSLADIDAVRYPFLKLTLRLRDPVDRTAAQWKKWIVTYTPMAEGLLTFAPPATTQRVQEGEPWRVQYGFTNISSRSFSDSLSVNVDVFNADQKVLRQEKLKIKAPVPRDTTKFWVSLTTKGMAGPNDVTVFVNPRVQPEMYFDNNVLSLFQFLTVQPDRTAPVLDVTVDGRYLTNSDVVSADPRILAKVIDKNPFIMKTDTVGVDLFLRSPCDQEDCPYKRINFSQPEVEWKPATATSDFQVFYHPNQLPPGVYALKANARDGSGNASGELPYEVSFVVSDKTDFAVRSVYPNPSRDVFNFKVFMSGTAAPTDFQLTIYSATGSLVRSFGNEVLESLHIGTNEISLKAVDASGLPLPSGLYVYKMVSALGNKTFTASGRLAVAR